MAKAHFIRFLIEQHKKEQKNIYPADESNIENKNVSAETQRNIE